MGNQQSSGRSQGHGGQFQSLDPTIENRQRPLTADEDVAQGLARRRTGVRRSLLGSVRHSGIYESLTRRATALTTDSGPEDREPSTLSRGADEQESSPLVDITEDNATADSSIGILVRSASTMSRLGSRLLPDPVMRGLLSSGEETAEEGEALRQGTSRRRRPSVFERRAPSANNERFHLGGSIRRRLSRNETRRTIRGPFPLAYSDHQRLQNGAVSQYSHDSEGILDTDSTVAHLPQRRTRFSRFRNSLSFPLSGIFNASSNRSSTHFPRLPTPHPVQSQSTESPEHQAHDLLAGSHRLSHDDLPHELDAVEPEARNILSASRITSGMTSIRRFPHGLRSRSTRLIRRGEHPPLSQVLQLAAAAIAAQLSGHAASGGDGSRPLGGEAFDGSIQNFVQTLQDAASAQAGENIDLNASDGDLPPVNFMRVFQFPNDENGTPISHVPRRDSDRMDVDSQDRSVTLVLVGVRSMPNVQEGAANEGGTLGPSLDTLLSLPFLPPANILRNGSSGALFRRSDTRMRNSRRHSMTNFNFPAQYETQRHHRTRTAARRGSSEQPLLVPNHNVSLPISESPPGPHPPPSTPADMRSGQATPTRRPSSASATPTPLLPNLQEDNTMNRHVPAADSGFTAPRQRRRSDSEFARRPELGSGAARRNGMVEPDRPTIGTGRSWLIYVVGTNVSPDHPAFTMPSLFTDNPSYEDMQMLSTLLGPVKPPVATQDDINSAGGNYRLETTGDLLIAHPTDSEELAPITISDGDRCLICLCEYEVSEIVRQLNSCRHVFHRDCVDEWLTTGRNSCPMCRGKGVPENSASTEGPTPASPAEQTT